MKETLDRLTAALDDIEAKLDEIQDTISFLPFELRGIVVDSVNIFRLFFVSKLRDEIEKAR